MKFHYYGKRDEKDEILYSFLVYNNYKKTKKMWTVTFTKENEKSNSLKYYKNINKHWNTKWTIFTLFISSTVLIPITKKSLQK